MLKHLMAAAATFNLLGWVRLDLSITQMILFSIHPDNTINGHLTYFYVCASLVVANEVAYVGFCPVPGWT
jgi:hypothetical protein